MTTKETLPSFEIDLEGFIPSLLDIIERYKAEINNIAEKTALVSLDTFTPLDVLGDEYHNLISPISHLTNVKDSKEIREVWEKALPIMSEFGTWVGFHKGLAVKIEELTKSNTLDEIHQRIFYRACINYDLSGVNLPEDKKERFAEIAQRLSELENNFSKNSLDATKAWTYHVHDEERITGVPETAKALLKANAKAQDMEGWLLTLDAPSLTPVMTFCTNRGLREKLYKASATKASELSDHPEFDNTEVIAEIMSLRKESAELIGKGNPADLSLINKMANSPTEVTEFMDSIVVKVKPRAGEDEKALRKFAASKGCHDFEVWDRAFYAELMQQETYNLDSEKIKEYFQLDYVLLGLNKLVYNLYGVEVIQEDNSDVWHNDVRFFRLYKDKQHIASLYMDLYADPERKRSGAWMDEPIIRWEHNGVTQLPVAYNVCNFQRPTKDTPSLLSHRDVETVFHEFGHALHHMLTEVSNRDISGINGVEWDAVELPSQIMENWCWEKEVLADLSCHYKTNEKLPDEMFENMLAAKNFMGSHAILRQMEFGLFDMLIHMEPSNGRDIRTVLQGVRNETSVYDAPDYNRFENSFGHIFSGGYAAGYYSYIWAQCMADDCFSKFEEEGIFNADTANNFRKEILSKGGSFSMNTLFRNFMKRDLDPDAMLKKRGII